MAETRNCPYCAEEISVEAVRCRYCRSFLVPSDPARWHRSHPGRRLAGVASAIAAGLGLPVAAVRVSFIVLTFVHFLGLLLYIALWIVIPNGPGDDAPLDRALMWLKAAWDFLVDLWNDRPRGDGAAPRPSGDRASSASVPDLEGPSSVAGGPTR